MKNHPEIIYHLSMGISHALTLPEGAVPYTKKELRKMFAEGQRVIPAEKCHHFHPLEGCLGCKKP